MENYRGPYDLTDWDRERLRDTVRRDRIKRIIRSGGTSPGKWRGSTLPGRVADPVPGTGTAADLRRRIDYLFTKEGNCVLTEIYLASRACLGHATFYRLRREIDGG